ncbi:hypothetical protein CTEN210_08990 [Chaetoceros tenuissimus]|uniref:Uncharacterized protein n=1 Tax=Chaetoceros tenuissimus TaxID=426638 RepID=A0AAD3CXP2_9STRA|nr:hypothetical protein CTEN210_08990 [Chaetoceros tenuissimus]
MPTSVSRFDIFFASLFAIFSIFLALGVQKMKQFVADAKYKLILHNLNHTVTDNFIKETDLISRLQNETLWQECDEKRAHDNFWQREDPITNIWEELSQEIWKNRPEYKEAVGFEYWCNIVDEDRSLPWHVDKDEYELEENEELVYPIMGAVYYGFDHKFEGSGNLMLVDIDAEYEPFAYDDELNHEVVRVEPIFNRMIIFNASKWHRVETNFTGNRYTFAVNALRHKPRGPKKN